MQYKSISIVLLLIMSSILLTCNKQQIRPKEFPVLKTLEVSSISENGASFNGKIVSQGDGNIIEYGFVWSINTPDPTINDSDQRVLADEITVGSFSAEITTTLFNEGYYHVRAYAKTDNYLVYGKDVGFKSLGSGAPQIISTNPEEGTIGDTIQIYGSGFSYRETGNDVKFNDLGSNIFTANDSIIAVVVPMLDTITNYITVSTAGKISEKLKFKTTSPHIESFSNTALGLGEILTIYGNNFSYKEQANVLTIGDIFSTVIYSDKEKIKAVIPSGLQSENIVKLTIAGQSIIANQKIKFLEPKIISVEPLDPAYGDTVAVIGENFSSNIKKFELFIGNTKPIIVSASSSEILFIVPDNLNRALNDIKLSLAGRSLSYKGLRIKSPVINSVSPSRINDYDIAKIEIFGEGFNLIPANNRVLIGGYNSAIIEVDHNKIVVDFPSILIPEVNISYLDSFDISVRVLDQSVILKNGLILDYRNRWIQKKAFPGLSRINGIQFESNGKGYLGLGVNGESVSSVFYKDLWEYDPITDNWIKKSDFPGQSRADMVIMAINSKVYITGGLSDYSFPFDLNNEVWEYDPLLDQWTQMNDFPGIARTKAFGFGLSEKGYMGGGEDNTQKLFDFWEYNPLNDSWVEKKSFDPTQSFYSATGFSINNYGYVLPDLSNEVRRYDVALDTWILESHANAINQWGNHPFIIDNQFFVLRNIEENDGGKIDVYDISTKNWNTANYYGDKIDNFTTFSINNKGYLLLGKNITGQLSNDVWEYE